MVFARRAVADSVIKIGRRMYLWFWRIPYQWIAGGCCAVFLRLTKTVWCTQTCPLWNGDTATSQDQFCSQPGTTEPPPADLARWQDSERPCCCRFQTPPTCFLKR